MVEYKNYPIAIDRAEAYINKDDIKHAADLFEKDYGYLPTKIYVNPKILRLIGDNTGYEILEHNGIATWDVWVEKENFKVPVVSKTTTEPLQSKSDVSKIPEGIILPKTIMKRRIKPLPPLSSPVKNGGRGRPLKAGEVSRVTDWRRRKKMQGRLEL